ncbi:methyl-accepting chemotaxis protein [Grimontia marina]|uniref:Methyl-accepting chemotaxis protein McpS n=1 Tax=Grimontia marina TaxID=646534 RepID=A0A128FJ06_9GAMM|nr:methyl-accepting chemotaxis protein [Grimontia marina]CZF86294.1 Methyl-accepting chemotaxis protein McpS [Grimontia marina]
MTTKKKEEGLFAKFHSVTYQLKGIVALVVLALCFIGYKGISGMNSAAESLDELYSQGMQHAIRAGNILRELGDARSHLLLAMQHDPATKFANLHDHPIDLHYSQINEALATLHQIVDNEIVPSKLNSEERRELNRMVDILDRITDQGFVPAVTALKTGQFETANLVLLNTINPLFDDISAKAKAFLNLQNQEGRTNYQSALKNVSHFLWIVGCTIVFSLIVLSILFTKIISRVKEAISELESTSKAITNGDLTRRVDINGRDEFARIGEYVNVLVGSFQGVVKSTLDSTGLIATSASESALVTNQTQKNVLDQQAQTQMIATAIHEFTATVHEVANNTAYAATASQQADTAAADGQKVVLKSIAMIEHLSQDLEATVNSMLSLKKHTEAIGSVVETIQEVSEQTNLLALNAAIEAARAGEQGRGFAVVADEVRSLAQRTQTSTIEIQRTIQQLQDGSRDAMTRMQKGNEQALETVRMAQKAGEALSRILQSVDEINAMNTQIATAAEQQSSVTEEINKNITVISSISDQTATGPEESRIAASSLQELSNGMKSKIQKYIV